jgi:hypothetical protein
MTTRERITCLDMARRDALMLRHDWARAYGNQGQDYITRALDTAIVGMVVEIQYLEERQEAQDD